MSTPATVELLTLAEYAQQDVTGKYLVAGMFTGSVNIPEPPITWPQFWVFAIIRPMHSQFNFSVSMIRPDERSLFRFVGKYNKHSDPTAIERLAINFQIPGVRFTGFGIYKFRVQADEVVLYESEISVMHGAPPVLTMGEVFASVEIDAEL